jgi:two-component system, response regulator PdtaR
MSFKQQPVVLVVEDEALILLNTVDDLERSGYRVIEAGNATLALQLLAERGDITHLFTDIDLPGQLDGLGLAAVVRERWPGIRIILTSGHMLPHSFDLPQDAKFVSKPYRLSDIRTSIAEPWDLH